MSHTSGTRSHPKSENMKNHEIRTSFHPRCSMWKALVLKPVGDLVCMNHQLCRRHPYHEMENLVKDGV